MHEKNTSLIPRRSSRVPTSIPVLVTSLDPTAHFSEVCETLVVNAHGCAMRSRRKVETGVRLRLRSRDGRDATGQVVSCQPLGSDSQTWILGTTLDRPDNFWGMRNCPKDWVSAAIPGAIVSSQVLQPATTPNSPVAQTPIQTTLDEVDSGARQRAEEIIKRMLAESMRPLQAEVAALNEKLARKDANPSRFDVSLSSIPPELEQQLETRLRKDLEPKILEQARQQSAHLLAEARAAIDSNVKKAHERFSQQLDQEQQTFQQQAKKISIQISEDLGKRLNMSFDEFQQKLIDGGNQLKKLSQELLEFMQGSLSEDYAARLAEGERLQSMISSESSRLQECTARLETRIEKLNDSVQSLESGLDHRLSEMYSRVVKDTRTHLETAAHATLSEFSTRTAELLEAQQEHACEKLRHLEKGIAHSVSATLETKVSTALQAFEQSTQETAKTSVERWSLKLGAALAALAKNLEGQLE